MDDSTSKPKRKRLLWEERLASYSAAFAASNGNGNEMPKETKKWAENQRQAYIRGGLSDEKIKKLNEIKFNWRLRNSFLINNNNAVAYCSNQDESMPEDPMIKKWMSNTIHKLKNMKDHHKLYSSKAFSILQSNKQLFAAELDRKPNIKMDVDTRNIKTEFENMEEKLPTKSNEQLIKLEQTSRNIKMDCDKMEENLPTKSNGQLIKLEQIRNIRMEFDEMEEKVPATQSNEQLITFEQISRNIKMEFEEFVPKKTTTATPDKVPKIRQCNKNIFMEKNNVVITMAVNAVMSFQNPLTQEEVDNINIAMGTDMIEDNSLSNTGEGISKIGLHKLTHYDFRKLRHGIWLNDEVINWWMYILFNYDIHLCNNTQSKRHMHCFNSFFVQKIYTSERCYCFKHVETWSKKVFGKDIFQLELVFFPINIGNHHWVAVIAKIQDKTLEYYDSFGNGEDYCDLYLGIIFRYLKDEHRAKNDGLPLKDEESWKLQNCSLHCPKQENGYDCGVFVCAFAYHLVTNQPFNFNNDYVTEMRRKMGRLVLSMCPINFITHVNENNVAEMILTKTNSVQPIKKSHNPMPLYKSDDSEPQYNFPSFPLCQIGPLNKKHGKSQPPFVPKIDMYMQTSVSSVSNSNLAIKTETKIDTQFKAVDSLASCNSGHDHFSSDRSFLSTSFDSGKDADQVHNAICGALSWLYSVRHDTTRYGLTQTIVNAITYLPTYYSNTKQYAGGYVDWTKVPIIEDSGYYPSVLPKSIPSNVRFILNLDNYWDQFPNIHSKRIKKNTIQRYLRARNFPPLIIYTDKVENKKTESPSDFDNESDYAYYPFDDDV